MVLDYQISCKAWQRMYWILQDYPQTIKDTSKLKNYILSYGIYSYRKRSGYSNTLYEIQVF